MSKLIKIHDDKTVSIFSIKEGIDAEKEAKKVGGILYDGEIPDSTFLKWENEKVIIDETRISEYNIKKAKAVGEVYTLNDVDYQVSFMKDDADGMMQVSIAFQLGLTETVIYFENGTKMPIKNTEFEAFAIWFVGKRNSFFVGD